MKNYPKSTDLPAGAERWAELAAGFSRLAARGNYTVGEVYFAALSTACFAGKATGTTLLKMQEVAVKLWSTVPDEAKSVQ